MHEEHMWAFFDSAYTVVDLSKAKVEYNTYRIDQTKQWMGIRFE